MRLRKIKLSGFKSFVDPTTLTVPGQVVGIVGPNGCGKSNIIDAVTWVMGESSAKHLRGDSLTDVIFNGSNQRQPVSQASVELIFDNTEKKLTGEYASYSEISVKRQINREAVSTYYLNGTRCRRRDIQGIFLGTGLGPRGYSIIEQGTISRLIEAKPEELRGFVEEAAGISKYRERRRETENRIKHTKENLSRVNDIYEELEKQLSHLQRQARAAERYKELKSEERKYQAELLALNWQELNNKNTEEQKQIVDSENKVEQAIAQLREHEADLEKQRSELSNATEKLSEQQSVFYQVGSNISSIEQTIKHTNERIEASQKDLQAAEQQSTEIQAQFSQDKQRLTELGQEIISLEPKLNGSRSESDKAYEGLSLAENAMQSWQTEWDSFQQQAIDCVQTLEASKSRKEYLETSKEEQIYRLQSLQEEYDGIEPAKLEESLVEKKQAIETAVEELENIQEQLNAEQKNLEQLLEQQQSFSREQNEKREQKQKVAARLETLKALQESALGDDDKTVADWLEKAGLNNNSRLAQQLKIDSDWSVAFEIVLAQHLQAVCIDNLNSTSIQLNDFASGKVELIENYSTYNSSSTNGWHSLADKVIAPEAAKNLVANIWIANDLTTALTLRDQLEPGHSIVTKDGLWIGQNWVRVVREGDTDSSIITREQNINELNTELSGLEQQLHSIDASLEDAKENISEKNTLINSIKSKLQEQQTTVSENKGQLAAAESQLEQLTQRAEKLKEQIEELERNHERDADELIRIAAQLVESEELNINIDSQKSELESLRDKHRQSLDSAREIWQKTHEESHLIALQLEAITSQKASLEQAIKRNEMQIEHVTRRKQELDQLIQESSAPLAELQTQLETKLAEKVTAEKDLTEARTEMQNIEASIRETDEQRVKSEQAVAERRDELEKIRIKTHETKVRLQGIEEQFESSETTLENILETLTEEASQQEWEKHLESLARKIQRLGAINLAAIDELAQLSERREYLDKQRADLNEALETLETAIRKIDQETKERFKQTFDHLNSSLKELFPQVFGGGSAYLELTSQDLLETGITIMARPPGKRNTTIHLLSGGEKALTAVALVFSIFKLNPSPFCILDEVDAPLDDANAARFSELVKSMSDDVQFIVITHNKITMEIAQQLLGVTMHEPGVSRLVTVDVDAAVEMAASA